MCPARHVGRGPAEDRGPAVLGLDDLLDLDTAVLA